MYLNGIGLILPEASNFNEFVDLVRGRRNIEFLPKYLKNNLLGYYANPQISPENPFYPKPQDIKILRTDVLAAVIAAQSLVNKVHLERQQLLNANLWMTTGFFDENIIDENSKLIRYLSKAYQIQDKKQRIRKIYRAIPPLLGLNTLTNLTESYVAQYIGAKGSGTQLGNTSASGYYAVGKALAQIKSEATEIAIVGGSNVASISCLLTANSKSNTPKSITGAILILLEKKRRRTTYAKIDKLITCFPESFDNLYRCGFRQASDVLVVYNPFGYDYEQTKWRRKFQLDKIFGYVPGISAFLSILYAISIMEIEGLRSVDCLDFDYFGRMSFLTIKSDK